MELSKTHLYTKKEIEKIGIEKSLRFFSEDNEYLYNLLKYCYENNISTKACCIGHEKSNPYLSININSKKVKKSILNIISILYKLKSSPIKFSIFDYYRYFYPNFKKQPKYAMTTFTGQKEKISTDDFFAFLLKNFKTRNKNKSNQYLQHLIDINIHHRHNTNFKNINLMCKSLSFDLSNNKMKVLYQFRISDDNIKKLNEICKENNNLHNIFKLNVIWTTNNHRTLYYYEYFNISKLTKIENNQFLKKLINNLQTIDNILSNL